MNTGNRVPELDILDDCISKLLCAQSALEDDLYYYSGLRRQPVKYIEPASTLGSSPKPPAEVIGLMEELNAEADLYEDGKDEVGTEQ